MTKKKSDANSEQASAATEALDAGPETADEQGGRLVEAAQRQLEALEAALLEEASETQPSVGRIVHLVAGPSREAQRMLASHPVLPAIVLRVHAGGQLTVGLFSTIGYVVHDFVEHVGTVDPDQLAGVAWQWPPR